VWFSSWDQLREMAPVVRSVLAVDDPVATEAATRYRAAAHGLRTNSEKPAVSRRLTVSIALCGAAVMAVLLLSAVHLIHF
jgi:hypothetical protein